MTDEPDLRAARSTSRIFWLGFLIGVGVVIPATILALVFAPVEEVLPIVVPATAVLGAFTDRMAAWNGLVNVALTALVNGLIYGAIAVAVAGVVRFAGRRQA